MAQSNDSDPVSPLFSAMIRQSVSNRRDLMGFYSSIVLQMLTNLRCNTESCHLSLAHWPALIIGY